MHVARVEVVLSADTAQVLAVGAPHSSEGRVRGHLATMEQAFARSVVFDLGGARRCRCVVFPTQSASVRTARLVGIVQDLN